MSMIKRVTLALLVLFALVGPAAAASLQSLFAPDAELWTRWTESDENATASIEHEPWSAFLGKYRRIGADGIARISYAMVTPQDRETLDTYIDRLAGLSIGSYARGEQFSYWVNLYNALTVQTVLSAYPVESIRDIDISPGLFADGPWDAELIFIEGEEVTLNDIEHRILRPIWNDPRIHYVLNCASLGCPNIGARAFGPDEMESMLDEAARLYINSPRGVRIESGALVASRIYDWFNEDFGASEQEIIAHFRRYAGPELAELLIMSDRIDRYEYDWALNDTQ
jgi:hypothetical protein